MTKQATGSSPPRRLGLLLRALLIVAFPAAAFAQGTDAEQCAECHEDTVSAFKMTGHGKQGFANLSTQSCASCHAGAAEHLASPNDPDKRPSFKKLSAREQADTCTGCHSGGQQALWDGSVHQTRGLSCVSCHSVHNPQSHSAQLKTAQVMDTCFECHKDVRAETKKTSHHPIREGRIGCSDCHNPHGTSTPKMITAASVNDQCYQCHTEKRGPFLWEHAPVREDCTTCHTPHGSNHNKLQKTAVPYLCQQCHSNTRHPGTLYDATTLPGAARASNREFNRGCLNCHAAIHGSNHPSGPYLGR